MLLGFVVQQGVAQGCSYIHVCVYQWSIEGSGLGMELIQGVHVGHDHEQWLFHTFYP